MGDARYYLGIDAGGTKTVAWIVNENGEKLGEGRAEGANPHNMELEEALGNMGAAVLAAKAEGEKKISAAIEEFAGGCIGLAGLDTQADRVRVVSGLKVGMLKKLCKSGLVLVNDGLVCLRSGIDKNMGVSFITGTGSNVYGINGEGREAWAGNWGFLLGDQGSGFAMGLNLLRQAVKEYDGRAEVTILTEKLLDYLNLAGFADLVRWAYRDPLPIRDIAGLTKMFNDPEVADLPMVDLVIEEAVEAQQDAYRSVVNQLGLKGQEFTVVLGGGLMKLETSQMATKLKVAVKEVTPQAQVLVQEKETVEGAIAIAKEVSGEDKGLYQRFWVGWE